MISTMTAVHSILHSALHPYFPSVCVIVKVLTKLY